MEQQAQPGDGEHPEPEGRAGNRDNARDVRPVQPGGGIDPVSRRPAGQQRQAEIVAERIAGERGGRRRPPAQRLADHTQRDHVVEGQRDIAGDGEADRQHDLARIDGVKGAAHIGQPDRTGQVMQRRQPQRDQQHDRADRQIAALGPAIGDDPVDHGRKPGGRCHAITPATIEPKVGSATPCPCVTRQPLPFSDPAMT